MRNRKNTGAMLSPCRTPTVVEFDYLFFNLENNDEVAIHVSHGRDEARRGAVLSLKDVEENVMWLAAYCMH